MTMAYWRNMTSTSSKVVLRGSLEVFEAYNGWVLYGKSPNRDMSDMYPHVYLGHLGDMPMPLGYDPNEDADLPDAYDFKVV